MASPKPLFQRGKLALHFVGRPALHLANQIADSKLRRHRYKHVDMISGENAPNDTDTILCANLMNDFTSPKADVTLKNVISVLRRPDDMEPVVKNAMLAFIVLHVQILPKMSLYPSAAHFWEDLNIRDSLTLKRARLKTGG